jgi:hypothetical protein
MPGNSKITTGLNDRPKSASIAQSGPGIPDDSGSPIEADDGQIERMKEKLTENPREKLKKEVQERIEASQKGSE